VILHLRARVPEYGEIAPRDVLIVCHEESLQQIDRTGNTLTTFVEDVGVDHRGTDIGMTQQLLHGTNVVTAFQSMGGERMPECMRRRRLGQVRIACRLFHGSLNGLLLDIVATNRSTAGIGG